MQKSCILAKRGCGIESDFHSVSELRREGETQVLAGVFRHLLLKIPANAWVLSRHSGLDPESSVFFSRRDAAEYRRTHRMVSPSTGMTTL
jgi:hypothetical protein